MPSRQVHPSLTALGRRELPETLDVRGRCYAHKKTFKNDFFAVTAMYSDDQNSVILKVHRQVSFLLLPMRWVGRLLVARECACFEILQDVQGVPRLIQRWGTTGVIREFVPGKPLTKGEPVPDDFFDRLGTLVETMHCRGLAYVDLEKCENVLVSDRGTPFLFDFQIAWCLPKRWGGELWPARVLRGWLQTGDKYHLLKLQRRTRPDQLTAEQIARSYRRPWYLRVHSWITRPFTLVRRAILDRIDPKRDGMERGRVIDDGVTHRP